MFEIMKNGLKVDKNLVSSGVNVRLLSFSKIAMFLYFVGKFVLQISQFGFDTVSLKKLALRMYHHFWFYICIYDNYEL